MKRKSKKRTVYELSRIKTRAMKHDVPRDLWPLFDHMFVLAASSPSMGTLSALASLSAAFHLDP
jgi:hypothetical protein